MKTYTSRNTNKLIRTSTTLIWSIAAVCQSKIYHRRFRSPALDMRPRSNNDLLKWTLMLRIFEWISRFSIKELIDRDSGVYREVRGSSRSPAARGIVFFQRMLRLLRFADICCEVCTRETIYFLRCYENIMRIVGVATRTHKVKGRLLVTDWDCDDTKH